MLPSRMPRWIQEQFAAPPEVETTAEQDRRLTRRQQALIRSRQRQDHANRLLGGENTVVHCPRNIEISPQQVQELPELTITNSCLPDNEITNDSSRIIGAAHRATSERRMPHSLSSRQHQHSEDASIPPAELAILKARYAVVPGESTSDRKKRLARKASYLSRLRKRLKISDQTSDVHRLAAPSEVDSEYRMPTQTSTDWRDALIPPAELAILKARYAVVPGESSSDRKKRQARKATHLCRLRKRVQLLPQQPLSGHEATLAQGATPAREAGDVMTTDSVDDPCTITVSHATTIQQTRLIEGDQVSETWFEVEEGELALHQLGRMNQICPDCAAHRWPNEKSGPCCSTGKIKLEPYRMPPPEIMRLLTSEAEEAVTFRRMIRAYNSVLAFASMSANYDRNLASSRSGVYTFRVHGTIHHMVGPLRPDDEQSDPKFAQIYFYDPDYQLDRRTRLVSDLNPQVPSTLQAVLHDENHFVRVFKQAFEMIRGRSSSDVGVVRLVLHTENVPDPRRYNAPTVSDVAVVIPGNEHDLGPRSRRIVLFDKRHPNCTTFIDAINRDYDPLHYVLMFPYGTPGWHIDIPHLGDRRTGSHSRTTCMEYYSYHLQVRSDTYIHLFGRLYLQYVVDMFAKMDGERLKYLRRNQDQIRAHLYCGLQDALANDTTDGHRVGTRIVLPSSYMGGPRCMQQRYQNAMALVRTYGKPDLFITFTCNPQWTEIQDELLNMQRASDRPDIVARVFLLKKKAFLKRITKDGMLGRTVAHFQVIEFQKRGLPHAHILIIFAPEDKPSTVDHYDRLVCAQLPDPATHPRLFRIVTGSMIHGPCGEINPNSPCMKDGKCTKGYPKAFRSRTEEGRDSYPLYARPENGRTAVVGRFEVDNRWVVPYNPRLLLMFEAHINVEVCASISSVKYIYKYVCKGSDRVVVSLQGERASNPVREVVEDEIERYIDARYVSSIEAVWRLYAFDLFDTSPPVMPLDVHLPREQRVYFAGSASLQQVIDDQDRKPSKLLAWFRLNEDQPAARIHRYIDIPRHFTWNAKTRSWHARRTSAIAVGRVYYVSPREKERFCLRLLLGRVRGARSFEDLRTVDGEIYETFHGAALALELIVREDELEVYLHEASNAGMPFQLRELFAVLLSQFQPDRQTSLHLWETFKTHLAEDFLYQYRQQGAHEDDRLLLRCANRALLSLQDHLSASGDTLQKFGLPTPTLEINADTSFAIVRDELLLCVAARQVNWEAMVTSMNADQTTAYNAIVEGITEADHGNPAKLFFVDGPGGTGKTFLYKTLIAKYRSMDKIVLAVASSGLAATLMHGGRTAHFRFKVPLEVHESSTCNIPVESPLADLIQRAAIILWDEAPMNHKFVFEAVDRSLQDVCCTTSLFGGKTMVFGGDFRQTLPVVARAGRADIVDACIKRSFIWRKVQVLTLSINMRIRASGATRQTESFHTFQMSIGNGRPGGAEYDIEIPAQHQCRGPTISDLIEEVFDELSARQGDLSYLVSRAILCPKNAHVDSVNELVLAKLDGDCRSYHSIDTVDDNDSTDVLYPTEFLNSLNISGLPPHKLTLKIGMVLMLLRSISQTLCNGTRLILRGYGNNYLKAEVATGDQAGKIVFIPRIPIAPTSLPFSFKRRQFPVRPAFAITINKSQGQTLSVAGLYLPQPVFSHGQLYVGISRASNASGLKILSLDSAGNQMGAMKNVVYREVLE